VRFTKFVASIFRDFFKTTGQNVTKHTSFERSFNLAPDDVIPAENNYYRSFRQKWLFPMLKSVCFCPFWSSLLSATGSLIDYLLSDNETTKWYSGFIKRVYIVVPLSVLSKRTKEHYTIIKILNYYNKFIFNNSWN